jgi:DNA-directed RNA polymerase subunit RPC12/RpoP
MSSSDEPEPPKPTTASIFAQAARTRRHVPADAKAARAVLTCEACGAPRTDPGPALACTYCGGKLVPRAVSDP